MNTFQNKPKFYMPFILAIVLSVGMAIGVKMVELEERPASIFTLNLGSDNKISQIIEFIDKKYVDSVDTEKLIEQGINGVIKNLDPHTAYVPARDFDLMNEPLKGNFEGIGIEFNIVSDTIVVISPISGGPSEKLGIRSGDRIVKIDDEIVAGIGIANKDVINKLRGKKGSKVRVYIFRRGKKQIIAYAIERDKIPINSLDVAYMVDDETAYMKLSRFASTTQEEFEKGLSDMLNRGMKKLILDLRGNPGGYLSAARSISDEFLTDNKLIVYTEGKGQPKQELLASTKGNFETGELVILIDEGSASASEIVAGAIQDWDRGVVIGRRSFGKGLVQEQSEFTDGSALRLTVARYYTPTGRCIQKPYSKGRSAYDREVWTRYEKGEYLSKDSIQINDTLSFLTPAGRLVYGGGGIIPDVFVPIDTTGGSSYLNKIFYTGVIHRFAFQYSDSKRNQLHEEYITKDDFISEYEVSESTFSDFVNYADENDVEKNWQHILKSKDRIQNNLKALIARQLWGNEGYYPIFNQNDAIIKKAIEYMGNKDLVLNAD